MFLVDLFLFCWGDEECAAVCQHHWLTSVSCSYMYLFILCPLFYGALCPAFNWVFFLDCFKFSLPLLVVFVISNHAGKGLSVILSNHCSRYYVWLLWSTMKQPIILWVWVSHMWQTPAAGQSLRCPPSQNLKIYLCICIYNLPSVCFVCIWRVFLSCHRPAHCAEMLCWFWLLLTLTGRVRKWLCLWWSYCIQYMKRKQNQGESGWPQRIHTDQTPSCLNMLHDGGSVCKRQGEKTTFYKTHPVPYKEVLE